MVSTVQIEQAIPDGLYLGGASAQGGHALM